MAKAHIHAEHCVKRWGGVIDDYLPISLVMDSPKGAIADQRFRALTHNSWFIREVLPRIFGDNFLNSDGRRVSTIEIGELHVLDDFGGFIPSAQDWLSEIEHQPWMDNGKGTPPSMAKIVAKKKRFVID